jgi:hypothetical protein
VETWFYRLSWHGQLVAGSLLFGISFVLEQQVLAHYLGSMLLGTVLAAGLEASKVLTIVLHRFLSGQRETAYPPTVRYLALLFRTGLLVLSALCSVMYLGNRLDRPAMEQVRQADIERLQQEAVSERKVLGKGEAADAARAEQAVSESYAALRRELEARYLPTIRSLEKALSAEMDRVVNGVFEGPRYRALDARLTQEKRAYDLRLTELTTREQGAIAGAVRAVQSDYRKRRADLARRTNAALATVRTSDYSGDPRVEDRMVATFLRTVAAVLGDRFTSVQFVFVFSLFLSVILELGIWVSFENLTGARLPVLAAEHKVSLRREQFRVETDGELAEEDIRETARRTRTRAWVNDAVTDLGVGPVARDGKLSGTAAGAESR